MKITDIKSNIVLTLFLILVLMVIVVGCGEKIQALDLLTAINEKESEVVQELLDSGIDPNKGPVPAARPLDGAYTITPHGRNRQ